MATKFSYTDESIPLDFSGSWMTPEGKWHQRCLTCHLVLETDKVVQRYWSEGIGWHEVEAHGSLVPGINVGILS